MDKSNATLAVIVAAVPLEGSSTAGHDQLLIYAQPSKDDADLLEIWETLSPTKCKKGRNEGEPFRDVRLAELGIDDFSKADETLLGVVGIFTYRVQKDADGEIRTDPDSDEPLYGWRLRRLTNRRVSLDD